ncbi:type II toxin-antitoxin system CcdA family antitoxin [Nocardia fluminea]
MAKSRITVTVDEAVVEHARRLGDSHLSAVVNAALAEHVERMARNAAWVIYSMAGIPNSAQSPTMTCVMPQ